ncbi:probable RRP15-like protein at C-terminar half [Coccomyxa sp. Obi]|nr:probable RRP15-like protein at C-terminar half [Coccomyxa sp. Obi]
MMAAAANKYVADGSESDPESWDTSGDEGNEPATAANKTADGVAKTSGRVQQRTMKDSDEGEQEENREGEDERAADTEHGELDIGDDDGEDDDEADDELGDEFEEEGAAAQERRTSHIDASASDSDREGEEDGGAGAGDNKAASFARAFAKIIASGQTQKGILSASKSLSKRKREDMEAAKADREAKALKREMRRKGHVVIPKKGEDPQHDMKEKALARIGTRGVVRLFNAVAKAQKQRKEALEGPKKKAAGVSKATFLAELQGQATKPQVTEQLVPVRASKQQPAVREPVEASSKGTGWAVLQDDLVGVAGTGTRLKDWDKAIDSEEDEDRAAEGEGATSSDEEPDW